MLAPRGQQRFHIFNERGEWVSTYWTDGVTPLWAEGAKVYLFGKHSIAGIPFDPRVLAVTDEDEIPAGNVIDFSLGIESPVMTLEKRYGSSGGIEYDPWERR